MLDRLDKKFGKYAIHNLIYYILGAYAIGYILYLAKPEWYEYIVLYPQMVMKGQVWRLFTWVCSIPQELTILTIFMFLFYYFIGKSLERYFGAFKYNLYIFSGWFITTLGVMAVYWITGAANGFASATSIIPSTNYLNLTSFLAFAVIFPETKVLFFGIIPVKMKILAWIDGIYLGIQVLSGLVVALVSEETLQAALETYFGYPPGDLEVYMIRQSAITLMVLILISFLNFFIFFGATAKQRAENRKRKKEYQEKMEEGRKSSTYYRTGYNNETGYTSGHMEQNRTGFSADNSSSIIHKCTICGRTNIDHPELMFRYCSKCEGDHEYCQDHLFTHEHIK